MDNELDYKKLRVDLMDFTLVVKEFANAVDIMSGFYQQYCSEYNEYWRLEDIMRLIIKKRDKVLYEIEKLRQNI